MGLISLMDPTPRQLGLRRTSDCKLDKEKLQLARNQVERIIHASQCYGCNKRWCDHIQRVLKHLRHCHNGLRCTEFKLCNEFRIFITHLVNCVDSHCLLCRKLVDQEDLYNMPNISSSVRQSEPAEVGELLEITVRVQEDDDDGDEDKENMGIPRATRNVLTPIKKKRKVIGSLRSRIKEKLHL